MSAAYDYFAMLFEKFPIDMSGHRHSVFQCCVCTRHFTKSTDSVFYPEVMRVHFCDDEDDGGKRTSVQAFCSIGCYAKALAGMIAEAPPPIRLDIVGELIGSLVRDGVEIPGGMIVVERIDDDGED